MQTITRIKLGVEKLRERSYRRIFLEGLSKDEIAMQIRSLRIKQGLRQDGFAKIAEMKQSAVSRIEQTEYSRWSFVTMLRVAAALDARLRVIFQPSEEAIQEYELLEKAADGKIDSKLGEALNPPFGSWQLKALDSEKRLAAALTNNAHLAVHRTLDVQTGIITRGYDEAFGISSWSVSSLRKAHPPQGWSIPTWTSQKDLATVISLPDYALFSACRSVVQIRNIQRNRRG